MNDKTCIACLQTLPRTEFYSDSRRGQPRSRCKSCHVAHSTKNKRKALGVMGTATYVAWKNAETRARQRGLEFALTLEWVRQRAASGRCEATGLPFRLGSAGEYRINPYGVSLDRLDPRGGYTPDNVRVVLTAFNIMRNEFDDELISEVWGAWRAHSADSVRDAIRDVRAVPPTDGH